TNTATLAAAAPDQSSSACFPTCSVLRQTALYGRQKWIASCNLVLVRPHESSRLRQLWVRKKHLRARPCRTRGSGPPRFGFNCLGARKDRGATFHGVRHHCSPEFHQFP